MYSITASSRSAEQGPITKSSLSLWPVKIAAISVSLFRLASAPSAEMGYISLISLGINSLRLKIMFMVRSFFVEGGTPRGGQAHHFLHRLDIPAGQGVPQAGELV